MPSKRKNNWMIYGATGYTGELVIKRALACGHKPILAGRNKQKLEKLAVLYQLECKVIDMDDNETLLAEVAKVDLVFHLAGPFIKTAEQMMLACIKGHTHYVDSSGEADAFALGFALNSQAKSAGISIVSGIGFDVIPTDVLLAYTANKINNPSLLELAIDVTTQPTPGTAKSALGAIREGKALIRRNGRVQQVGLGSRVKTVNFPSGKRTISLAPIADIYSAYYSTGVENINTYVAQPSVLAHSLKYFSPLIKAFLSPNWIMRSLESLIDKKIKGPAESYRDIGKIDVWARAENEQGDFIEAGLKTGEVYYLTSLLSIRFIEILLEKNPQGTLAPAQLFSMEELLKIEGVHLFDENQNEINNSNSVCA